MPHSRSRVYWPRTASCWRHFTRGSEIRHVEELWSIGVRLDFHFFEPDEIVETLARAGLKAERVLEREPYAGVEVETQRFYVLASKIAT